MIDDASASPSCVHLLTGESARLDHAVWNTAQSLDAFIAGTTQYADLWHATRRIARIDAETVVSVSAIASPLRLLVLLEDWCGDAISTVPLIQRMVEANPLFELRVTSRDAHPAIMGTHLSDASESIPVVMAYDGAGIERGWWGPRPSPLQEWVKREGLALEYHERYKRIRTWFARDRGATTIDEMLLVMRHADRHAERHAERSSPR